MNDIKPKIIIVNENDEIIGHKFRDIIKHEDIYRVSALWIKNSKGDVLLAQRSLNKQHDPGKWGPAVAGTNDEGDSYELNIIKETEEEIGIKDIDFEKAKKFRRTGRYNNFCQWFVATVDQEADKFKIQNEEVEQIKWFTKQELKKELENNPQNYFRAINYCLDNL